uniref:Senescence regulator n=1 Tax=Kalanchoe fedtschenkoi TaxID=63787 RepID=A0A7N0TAU1_KALFE
MKKIQCEKREISEVDSGTDFWIWTAPFPFKSSLSASKFEAFSMATGESYFVQPDPVFDFDESDVWGAAAAIDDREFVHSPAPSSKGIKKAAKKSAAAAASSLPVNVPDWSKILRGGCREERRGLELEEEEDSDEEGWVRFPPHEFLARQRRHQTASFSVHEGIGRTLKGRDLSRVRNAIWKQTGFED